MNTDTMRFRRRRLTILAVACVVMGLPLVLASHRGAVAFGIGGVLAGVGAGLLVVALLFSPLSRLHE